MNTAAVAETASLDPFAALQALSPPSASPAAEADPFAALKQLESASPDPFAALNALSPTPEPTVQTQDEEVILSLNIKNLGSAVEKGLQIFSAKAKDAVKRFGTTVKDYLKTYHPYVAMGAGIVIPGIVAAVNPEWAHQFIPTLQVIKLAAGMTTGVLASGGLEFMLGRETKWGKAAKNIRILASDVAIATTFVPIGVAAGGFVHEALPGILSYLPHAEAPAVSAPVEAHDYTRDYIKAHDRPVNAVPTAEIPPTSTPDAQPVWHAGQMPDAKSLGWADTHGHTIAVHKVVDGQTVTATGYYLDGDKTIDAYKLPNGQIVYHDTNGWAVDTDGNGKADMWYNQAPFPDATVSQSHTSGHLASPVHPGMHEGGGEPPLPDSIDRTGDGKPDLFHVGSEWKLDTTGDGIPDQTVKVDGVVNNGGTWDFSHIKVTSPDGLTDWGFDGTKWVGSDVHAPISPRESPTGVVVSGSAVPADKTPLRYGDRPWQLVDNGVDNTLQLISKLKASGSIDQNVLAVKLQQAADLWSQGKLDKAQHQDLWNLFHLSNGTASVYNNLQTTDTLKSLQTLGVVK